MQTHRSTEAVFLRSKAYSVDSLGSKSKGEVVKSMHTIFVNWGRDYSGKKGSFKPLGKVRYLVSDDVAYLGQRKIEKEMTNSQKKVLMHLESKSGLPPPSPVRLCLCMRSPFNEAAVPRIPGVEQQCKICNEQ